MHPISSPVLAMLVTALQMSWVILPCVLGAPSTTQLSDGKTMGYGSISNGLKWQSSGILTKGCQTKTSISDCYGLSLTSDPTKQLDTGFPDSPRQRIEFRAPSQSAGTTRSYTWKHYLDPSVGTSSHFFHLAQIFDEQSGNPIITLDAIKGGLVISDFVRSGCNGGCPAVSLGQYTGRTTRHSLLLTVGSKGRMVYTVTDADSGKQIITYTASGAFGSTTAYIKFGAYRATFTGMTPVIAATGDYTSTSR